MQTTASQKGSVPTPGFTSRERFLAACAGQVVDRPPVWLMRQAGRVLPEYRLLKEKYTFLQLVQTPALAAEVTLQPVRRFGFDGAILFSDILVIPEALGQPYHFRETGGIAMDFKIDSAADIDRLTVEAVVEKLHYVAATLKLLRVELGTNTALIGFSGSPWTLATFMLEGGSVPVYTRAKALLASDPKTFARLMEKLTAAVTAYLQMQIAAGVDALQIFDSHGGHLPPELFFEASGRWMKEIIARLEPHNDQPVPPVIVFSLGTHGNWDDLAGLGAAVLGIDAHVSLAGIRRQLPATIGVQGNLDPSLLLATPSEVAAETRRILTEMRGMTGHIFNLGHGVPLGAKLENVSALVQTVKEFK
ncbi:MAG TPA: uroporphyrinogen decarboxylase [Candidatus Acidoferrum sp.]|nr:uroporphyrinogen decarboxylase [Candidatus Acidoferrum sp.]